jgi:hypothetical protein
MKVAIKDDELEEWYKILSKEPLDEDRVRYVRIMILAYIKDTYRKDSKQYEEICAELNGDMA